MNFQNCASAPAGSAYPKKVAELFNVPHPKAARALLGAFLSEADAECGRAVMRSEGALVTACLVDDVDALTFWHAMNNGQVCRAFADADRPEVAYD